MNKQRGVATLVVVMVLLFLMALVAAYTSRNLIFEQRTSVNQYRSTQAFEAAEAGVEWALAMLNGGRVGSSCTEATATGTSTSFRQRYIRLDPATGMVQPVATVGLPGCVWTNGAWACECPDGTASTLTPPTTGGIAPAFRVRFTVNGLARPGVVRIESNGCTRLDNQCLNFPAGGQRTRRQRPDHRIGGAQERAHHATGGGDHGTGQCGWWWRVEGLQHVHQWRRRHYSCWRQHRYRELRSVQRARQQRQRFCVSA
jgi:hypothetical protein